MIFHLHKGFNLIELLLLLTMVSLLITFTHSGFFSLLAHHQTHKTTAQLFELLQWARSEAIKRNQLIGVCGSSDFQQCSPNWSHGYMVFVPDSNFLSNDHILRIEKNNKQIDIKSNQAVIKYTSDGRCLTRATLHISHSFAKQKIIIYDSGRARIETFAIH